MEQALDWAQRSVHEWGGDPRRVTLLGHSAGAHLAMMALLNRARAAAAAATATSTSAAAFPPFLAFIGCVRAAGALARCDAAAGSLPHIVKCDRGGLRKRAVRPSYHMPLAVLTPASVRVPLFQDVRRVSDRPPFQARGVPPCVRAVLHEARDGGCVNVNTSIDLSSCKSERDTLCVCTRCRARDPATTLCDRRLSRDRSCPGFEGFDGMSPTVLVASAPASEVALLPPVVLLSSEA